jgi:hypothetical protein
LGFSIRGDTTTPTIGKATNAAATVPAMALNLIKKARLERLAGSSLAPKLSAN